MKLRILVADESEAAFFDAEGINVPLQWVSKLHDEKARLQDRHLENDRPGRAFNRMAPGRHAMDGERSTQRYHQERFARRIAQEIENARHQQEFGRLVIIAGPRMLGLIRDALPDASRSFIAAEVPKDLIHLDSDAILNYVPREAFRRTVFTLGA